MVCCDGFESAERQIVFTCEDQFYRSIGGICQACGVNNPVLISRSASSESAVHVSSIECDAVFIQIKRLGLMARKLGDIRICLVASPNYLKQAGKPKTVSDLKRHNCIVDTAPQHCNRWSIGDKGKTGPKVTGNLTVNSGELVRELALANTGIALLPEFFVANDLAEEKLVALMKRYIQNVEASIFLVYPQTNTLQVQYGHLSITLLSTVPQPLRANILSQLYFGQSNKNFCQNHEKSALPDDSCHKSCVKLSRKSLGNRRLFTCAHA